MIPQSPYGLNMNHLNRTSEGVSAACRLPISLQNKGDLGRRCRKAPSEASVGARRESCLPSRRTHELEQKNQLDSSRTAIKWALKISLLLSKSFISCCGLPGPPVPVTYRLGLWPKIALARVLAEARSGWNPRRREAWSPGLSSAQVRN